MTRDWALHFWMLGVAIAHGLRFIVFDDDPGRQVVAVSGVLVYGIASVLALHESVVTAARGVALIFPLVGVLAVLLTGAQIDDWQLAVGVTQFAAMPYVLLQAYLSHRLKT